MTKDALGDRMKNDYENVTKTKLVRRVPVIIRLDGKAFHTFTKGFRKPFDPLLSKTMQETMRYLCKNIQGCVLGYTQSDEITLVLQDYEKVETSAWFDYDLEKVVSISASLATYAFNRFFNDLFLESISERGEVDEYDRVYDTARRKGAFFDCRAFNVPKGEVANCILWRQLDAERNSVLSLALSLFSHGEIQNMNVKQLISKIEIEKHVIWGNLPTTQKRGSCCVKRHYFDDKDGGAVYSEDEVYQDPEGGIYRKSDNEFIGFDNVEVCSEWEIDDEIPRFQKEGREYIEKLIMIGL